MLVLSRKFQEVIVIDGGIRLTVLGIRGNIVRLGVEAPSGVKILREEILERHEPATSPSSRRLAR